MLRSFAPRRRVLTLLITLLIGACNSASPSPSPSGSTRPVGEQPAATPLTSTTTTAALPPLADIPLYRMNVTANGIDPGPGPTGKPTLAWRVDVGDMHMVPILAGGLLIVGTNDGRLVALDAYTGAKRWDKSVGPGAILPSLAAVNGLVYASNGSAVIAVDLATGSKRWSTPEQGATGRLNVVDGVVYVGFRGGVVGLDAATGTQAWRWDGPAGVQANAGPFAGGVGYFATDDGRLYAIDTRTGKDVWPSAVQSLSTGIASGQVAGDTFYVSNNEGDGIEPVGQIYAIDRTSGNVRWRFGPPSGLQLKEGPIKDGVLYANGKQDGIWALRDEGSKVSVLWHVDAPASHWPMALVDNALYVARLDGSVGAYSTTDGTLLWETPSEGEWTGGPLVSGGLVFVANDRKGVMAFGDPGLVARLPRAVAEASPPAAPSTSAPSVDNPFSEVRAFPLAFACSQRLTACKQPAALGMDPGPDGLLYVLDTAPEVMVVDPKDGKVVRRWGSQGAGKGQFDLRRSDDNPGNGDVAVAPDGRVYVADGSNFRVQVFKPDGTFLFQFGSYGTGAGQFGEVDEIVVGRDGSVYVDEDYRALTKFTADGKLLWRADENVIGITVRKDGALLATCENCGYIQVLSPRDGHLVDKVEVPEIGQSFGPLNVDPSGNVYVTLFGDFPFVDGRDLTSALLVFDPSLQFIGGRYNTPDMLDRRDNYWPSPVFLPDGRAFTFGQAGLSELKVTLPTR